MAQKSVTEFADKKLGELAGRITNPKIIGQIDKLKAAIARDEAKAARATERAK